MRTNPLQIGQEHGDQTADFAQMFLEYCSHGDTISLLWHSMEANWRTRPLNNSWVPEPAIWHIFGSLVKAGLVMEQGGINHRRQRWTPITHLDIKPDNIFIGDYPPQRDGSNYFSMYPTFKLADFGTAFDAFRNYPLDQNLDVGTPGYLAPEQLSRYYGQTRPILNENTNVWGVGITIMALMNLDINAGELDFRGAAISDTHPSLVPKFNAHAQSRYSEDLRELVTWCLQYRQYHRPTFARLRTKIHQSTGLVPGRTDLAQGARYGTLNHLPAGLTLLPGLETSNYTLGLAMPA